MTKRVQFIGHSTAVADAFRGRVREVTVDTTRETLRVHNGSLSGGRELARADLTNVVAATITNPGKMSAEQAQKITSLLIPMALIYGSDIVDTKYTTQVNPANIPMNAAPVYNINTIFDTVTKRVVIPAGISFIRLIVQLDIKVITQSVQKFHFRKNGDGSLVLGNRNGGIYLPSSIAGVNSLHTFQFQSPVLAVTEGDYFQVGHDSFMGTEIFLYTSWLQVEGQ